MANRNAQNKTQREKDKARERERVFCQVLLIKDKLMLCYGWRRRGVFKSDTRTFYIPHSQSYFVRRVIWCKPIDEHQPNHPLSENESQLIKHFHPHTNQTNKQKHTHSPRRPRKSSHTQPILQMFLKFHNMFTKHTHTLTNNKNSGIRIQNILIAKRQNPYTPDKLV